VEANVTTNEEHLLEEKEIMPQIEEITRVPTKMMKDFVPTLLDIGLKIWVLLNTKNTIVVTTDLGAP